MRAFAISLLLAVILYACTFEQKPAPSDCSMLEDFSIINITHSNCGQANGSIEVQADFADGADPTISYQINGSAETTWPVFENLSAGTYEIVVRYNGSCSQTISAQIDNQDGLNISLDTSPSDCDESTGNITVNASGANGTIAYRLDNGSPQQQAVFENLSPGLYTVTASDESGCEVSQEIKLISTVKTAQIENIVQTNCAISSCHGGNISPNLSSAPAIISNANRIKQRTGNRSMPPASSGISLDQEEIDAIECWTSDIL